MKKKKRQLVGRYNDLEKIVGDKKLITIQKNVYLRTTITDDQHATLQNRRTV